MVKVFSSCLLNRLVVVIDVSINVITLNSMYALQVNRVVDSALYYLYDHQPTHYLIYLLSKRYDHARL